jgi:D-glycero-beta-D-manno-heptose-7-phosphate kinase
MVKLACLFNQLKVKRALVAGDFMLDRYIFGKAKRISPEAPVPVLLVDSEEERAGGAGNVVLNLLSLGMEVTALGRVGKDAPGSTVDALLKDEGASCYLFKQEGFRTPHKSRVIASNQQIVRIDDEKSEKILPSLEKEVLEAIDEIVKNQDVIAISDYAKGFLTENILQALIQSAKKHNVPVIADPKGAEFYKYKGATVLKPNLGEAITASGLINRPLLEVAKAIFAKVKVDVLMITRSEDGISLYYPDGTFEDHPVEAKEIRDVTGAGDTVLAMLSCSLANGLTISEATQLANIAATVAVERVGCARVTLPEVARRMIELHSGNKIFTSEHFSALEQALRGRNFTMLSLAHGCEVSTKLLKVVRDLGQDSSKELVVTISDPEPSEELVSVLASLKDVDYIHLNPLAVDAFHASTSVCNLVHFN